MYVAVEAELILPRRFWHESFLGAVLSRPSVDAAAQSEDKGRKMTTAVTTSDDIEGVLTKYCRIENSAAPIVSN